MATLYDHQLDHHYDPEKGIIITDDDARGGVTGHNVRYVLALGMTGLIAAFAGVAIYFGFDRLAQDVSAALAHSPSEAVRAFAPYATVVLAVALLSGLALGAWNLISGRSEDGSQSFMRFRVALQFAIVCVAMALLYWSAA